MTKTAVLDIVSTSSRKILDLTRLGFRDILLPGKYNYSGMRPPLKPNVLINMLQICYCGKGEHVYELDGTRYKIKGREVLVSFPGGGA